MKKTKILFALLAGLALLLFVACTDDSKNPFTVSFYVDNDFVCSSEAAEGESITLPAEFVSSVNPSAKFAGWYDESFSEKYGGAGDEFVVRADLKMYAKFE